MSSWGSGALGPNHGSLGESTDFSPFICETVVERPVTSEVP